MIQGPEFLRIGTCDNYVRNILNKKITFTNHPRAEDNTRGATQGILWVLILLPSDYKLNAYLSPPPPI